MPVVQKAQGYELHVYKKVNVPLPCFILMVSIRLHDSSRRRKIPSGFNFSHPQGLEPFVQLHYKQQFLPFQRHYFHHFDNVDPDFSVPVDFHYNFLDFHFHRLIQQHFIWPPVQAIHIVNKFNNYRFNHISFAKL